MGAPAGPGMVTVQRRHTAELTSEELAEARALCDAAFDGDFADADWAHALGGMHALVRDDEGRLVGHGALVLRRVLVGGVPLRCGYVEAVAVAGDVRRAGHGTRVMESLEALAPGYDLLALSASDAGALLYEARGWSRWRGPSSVVTSAGVVPTPDDDDSLYVLGVGLDLTAPITCDWRDGDVW